MTRPNENRSYVHLGSASGKSAKGEIMVRQYGKTSLGLALVVVLVSTLGLVGTAPGQATTPQADSQVKPYVIL